MKMQSAVEEYLVEIEVRKYTPKTIRSYRNNLNLFLRFCEQEAHIQEVEEISFCPFMQQKIVIRVELYIIHIMNRF